jgi:SpoOM protein
MFGAVKKILGIEGVKIELIVPTEVNKIDRKITGIIKLTALSDNHTIQSIDLIFVEKYSRGHGVNKLINEYTLGELSLKHLVNISKNDIIELPFDLNFIIGKSEMDRIEDSNFISKGIVMLAKKFSGVHSTYSIRAEAKVKGTTLSPFDKKVILLK